MLDANAQLDNFLRNRPIPFFLLVAPARDMSIAIRSPVDMRLRQGLILATLDAQTFTWTPTARHRALRGENEIRTGRITRPAEF